MVFVISALPALYVLVLRRHLPEPLRYLLLRKGRNVEAREAAERLGAEPTISRISGAMPPANGPMAWDSGSCGGRGMRSVR